MTAPECREALAIGARIMGQVAAAAGDREEALLQIGSAEALGHHVVEGRAARRKDYRAGREEVLLGAGERDLCQEIEEARDLGLGIGVIGAAQDALITFDAA